MTSVPKVTTVFLETGSDGRALFREDQLPLQETRPKLYLSAVLPATGLQLRESPPGYSMDFHCTVVPQWIIVIAGTFEIGLPDGRRRIFEPGEMVYMNDKLPAGATFDPAIHGHCSRQVGDVPLLTVMVKG